MVETAPRLKLQRAERPSRGVANGPRKTTPTRPDCPPLGNEVCPVLSAGFARHRSCYIDVYEYHGRMYTAEVAALAVRAAIVREYRRESEFKTGTLGCLSANRHLCSKHGCGGA
jgi:hypothetical protein